MNLVVLYEEGTWELGGCFPAEDDHPFTSPERDPNHIFVQPYEAPLETHGLVIVDCKLHSQPTFLAEHLSVEWKTLGPGEGTWVEAASNLPWEDTMDLNEDLYLGLFENLEEDHSRDIYFWKSVMENPWAEPLDFHKPSQELDPQEGPRSGIVLANYVKEGE